MGKIDRRIVIGLALFIILIFVGSLVYLNTSKIEISDSFKFKTEYEALNGEVNSSDVAYKVLNIDEENPFVYSTEEEIISILEEGNGIIYFGFSSCPWCRTLIPHLINAAESTSLNKIYYLNISDIRSKMAIEGKEVITTKDGTEGYYKILELMDEVLTEYQLIDKDNNIVEAKEKRLYAPTIISVVDGKIIDIHVGTLENHTNGYDELSEDQVEELNTILVELIVNYTKTSCDSEC